MRFRLNISKTSRELWEGTSPVLDITLKACSDYLVDVLARSNPDGMDVTEFLLGCDLFVLLLKRGLMEQADIAFEVLKSNSLEIRKEPNDGLL